MGDKPHYDSIVRHYYDLVDHGRLEELYALFSENISYNRCGVHLKGLAEFKLFYEKQRSLSGKHTARIMVVDANKVAVEGRFDGRTGAGEEVSFGFADFFVFGPGGKVDKRASYTDYGRV